jgi:23S rRNA (pseudouridine1915-N3)-methyltransferase
LRGGPFADDVAHYRRLLERHARIELVEVKEGGGDAGHRREVLRKEGEALLRRLPDPAFACALDREGTALSSEEIAAFLEERRREGRDLCFVVGGAFGLDRAVLDRADARLSLGPATLPHELARVVLLEQVFRAHKILAREPYHY